MSELYRDESYAPIWARFLLGGVTAMMAVTLGYQLITGTGLGSNPAPNSVLGVLLLLFMSIYLTFHKLTVTVNEHRVQLGYGVLKRNIGISNIESVELDNVDFIQYGGLGLKHNLKGELAYSTRTGKAVKINRRKGNPILFTPNNHETSLNTIRGLLP